MAAAIEIFKSGDLAIVRTKNGTVIVGNELQQLGDDHFRVGFSFKEGPVFDSSIDCSGSEIIQIVRRDVTIWFNRG